MKHSILNYDLREGMYPLLKNERLLIPEKFVFCINDSCSFRCKMCFNWTNKHKPRLSYGDWIKKLDEIYQYKQKDIEINIIGGEPLEMPWVTDLMGYAKRLGFTVTLSTNGYFIDEKMASDIVSSGLDYLSVSLDGNTPEMHDYVRGVPGAYDRAIRGMKFLKSFRESRPKIVVQSLIMGINLDELEGLVHFASDDKLVDDGIYFMAIMKPNSPNIDDDWRQHDKLNLWPRDISKVHRVITKLCELKEQGHKILNSKEQLMTFYNYFKYPDSFVKKKSCNVKEFGGFLESTGKVFICREFMELGDSKSRNIVEILNSGRSKFIRNKMGGCSKNCNYLINCFYQDED